MGEKKKNNKNKELIISNGILDITEIGEKKKKKKQRQINHF